MKIKFLKKSFVKNVLPKENSHLREICYQRNIISYNPKNEEKIPFNIEEMLLKLIIQEVKNFRNNETLKEILLSSSNFSFRDVFNVIDINQRGYLILFPAKIIF